MATADQILELRRYVNEFTNAGDWTDSLLSARIDATDGDVRAAAATIWREKAAAYSSLIDVTEGNSSRKLSQLQSQALKMAESFGGGEDGSLNPAPARVSRTRRIERL